MLKAFIAIFACLIFLTENAFAEFPGYGHAQKEYESYKTKRAAPGANQLKIELEHQDLVYEAGPKIEPIGKTPYPKESINRGTSYFCDGKIRLFKPAEVDAVVKRFGPLGQEESIRALADSRLKEEKTILLSEILPKFFQENIGKAPKGTGANCFNTTLNFNHPSTGIKHTTQQEMLSELKEHYRPLKKGEALRPGDILTVNGRHGLVHTAVYLGDDLFFHKATTFEADGYAIETYKEVMALWYALGSTASFARPAETRDAK